MGADFCDGMLPSGQLGIHPPVHRRGQGAKLLQVTAVDQRTRPKSGASTALRAAWQAVWKRTLKLTAQTGPPGGQLGQMAGLLVGKAQGLFAQHMLALLQQSDRLS